MVLVVEKKPPSYYYKLDGKKGALGSEKERAHCIRKRQTGPTNIYARSGDARAPLALARSDYLITSKKQKVYPPAIEIGDSLLSTISL
jgi:hypothetical protein